MCQLFKSSYQTYDRDKETKAHKREVLRPRSGSLASETVSTSLLATYSTQ